MEKQTVTICNAQMIRGAKYAGLVFGYTYNGERHTGCPEDIVDIQDDTEAVFLKPLPEERTRIGWDEVRTQKYEIVAKRIGDDKWEVPLEVILNNFI